MNALEYLCEILFAMYLHFLVVGSNFIYTLLVCDAPIWWKW